jgi:DNA-binding NtrC family response regulator
MNGEYLIVDDEPDICWALEHILAAKGQRCQKAQTAQAALELMKDRRFLLAFLDVALPDMNGFELSKRLRKMDPSMRFVFISGHFQENPENAAQIQNGDQLCACINKPFRHEEIFDVIEGNTPADGAGRG